MLFDPSGPLYALSFLAWWSGLMEKGVRKYSLFNVVHLHSLTCEIPRARWNFYVYFYSAVIITSGVCFLEDCFYFRIVIYLLCCFD